jgi:hypothetical protein
MQILIELNDNELKLMAEEEFEKMKDELDEFDGIHPYIIKGWLHDKKPICNVCNDYLDDDSRLQKGEPDRKYKDFRDYILLKEKEGKIVITTTEGLMEVNLDEIIKQPVEGLLYDLNRDRATILTLIKDEKWVNDFACMKVIEKLKNNF